MTQAALIAETIAGMKRAVARHDDSSDSDEPYLLPSNRGNKLKRKAHHIEDGHSGASKGLKIYKRSIGHAGYHRDILRRNPKRYDVDGYELDDDESDEEADARAAEGNPYADIRLEELLLPLTSAASLPDHPSLSVPYTSPILTDMAQQACDMVRRERNTLSNAKQLLTKLRGDETWIPCGLLYSESDEAMFNTKKLYDIMASSKMSQYPNESVVRNRVNGSLHGDIALDRRSEFKEGKKPEAVNGVVHGSHRDCTAASSVATNDTVMNSTLLLVSPSKNVTMEPNKNIKDLADDVRMAESMDNHITKQEPTPDNLEETNRRVEDEIVDIIRLEVSMTGQEQLEAEQDHEMGLTYGQPGDSAARTVQLREINRPEDSEAIEGATTNHGTLPDAEDGAVDVEGDSDSRRAPRRMLTRAKAQASPEPGSRNESSDSWVAPEIHPLFIIPEAAIPDKDFGLPPPEAEETRRMLMMYVQKQEEVCRGAEKLYDGLLKADAQRKTVYKWCKAEGHVGVMSDGEDWYDKEGWGLEEDLRKGETDADEDNTNQGKKTRGRRA